MKHIWEIIFKKEAITISKELLTMFPGWEFEVVVISTHFTHERNRQRDGLSRSVRGQTSSQGFQTWPLYNLGQHKPAYAFINRKQRSTYHLQCLRLLAPTTTGISWPEKAQMQPELHCKPSALRETTWLLVCRQHHQGRLPQWPVSSQLIRLHPCKA